MPTAGTHITITQRLALDPALKPLLGDPLADANTPEGKQMRFANLGAIGPDVFYAMADYGPELQNLEDFLVKGAGTFEALTDVLGQVQRYVNGVINVITLDVVNQIQNTANLITGIINKFFLSLLVDVGFNFWPVFRSQRQQDHPRTDWFWADYLHYVRTGQVVRKLLELGKGDPNLHAYALGYLTHYVTDVVGHPYVNQIVQAPWRMYWQRHHLVENFIDVYVWDRWHNSNPPAAQPAAEEQPLDSVSSSPNDIGSGAPFTFARLNDWISIGIPAVDPIDKMVTDLAGAIKKGVDLAGIGVGDPPQPNDPDFIAWTQMMERALKEVYDFDPHPSRLEKGVNRRPGGYPTSDDIAGAYGVMRFFLKLTTEEKIQEPEPPNIVADISQAVQKLLDDIARDIGAVRPPPLPSFQGHFSLSSLYDAIKNTAKWVVDTAAKVTKTVFDAIKDAIGGVQAAVSDFIKFGFFLINKVLFALYRSFRDVLVFAAYSVPFTDELAMAMGDQFNSTDLWQTKGNLGAGHYPVEEVAEERQYFPSSYAPIVPPNQQVPAPSIEQPPVRLTAPYAAGTPDLFIDAPRGPNNLFSLQKGEGPIPLGSDDGRNFGGAMANCKHGILLVTGQLPDPYDLPDYNLDGDRGYAWPCWQVDPEPTDQGAVDPLDPTDPRNAGTAHVKPKLL